MPDHTASQHPSPEERLDQWLDALNEPNGSMPPAPPDSMEEIAAVALEYRRVLGVTSPIANGRATIPERNGAMSHPMPLATPNGTWTTIERRTQPTGWMDRISQGFATALVIALLVALVGGVYFREFGLPTGSNDPTRVPGLTASPESTLSAERNWRDLFVVTEESDPIPLDVAPFSVATLGENGLTLPIGDGTVTFSDVADIGYTGVPGQALITRDDHSRAVVDLTTGDVLFDVPPFRTWEQDVGNHLFIPTDDALTDWQIVDLATGDVRMLSDILDLPDDSTMMPARIDPQQIVGDAQIFQVEEGRIDDVNFAATTAETGTFVIPGSLDRAVAIPDYPTTRDSAGSPAAVLSADGRSFAYETRTGDDRIVILDTVTGEEFARFGVGDVGDDPTVAGFTTDGRLVAGTGDRLVAIDWTVTDPVSLLADGFERLTYPLVYSPDDLVFAKQADALLRIDLATGEVTEVATGLVPGPFAFTVDGSPWITFYAQNGQTLLDARTGEIVSQMKPSSPSQVALYGGAWAGGDGDTFIFAAEPPPVAKSAWLLSPTFPDGLEMTVPADAGDFIFNVAPDGEHIYAKDSGYSRSGALWMTPLTAEPDWRQLAENVHIEARFVIPADTRSAQTLPAQDFATPLATPPANNVLSCSSSGYVPVIAGNVDAGDLAMIGFDGEAIVSADDGVGVPLPDGTTRTLPPGSLIYPDSGLALAVHDDNSATVTRISTGASWEYPSVEPRVAEQNWDFFSNGRYVVGPTDDSRTNWLITDTLTGDTRTTADILGEPFDGPLDLWTQSSSENGTLWLLQFMTLTFPDHDETPPADTGADPPGYLVLPGSLDDAWFSDRPVPAEPIETIVSPEGTTFIVNQVVRDARTGERIDTGDDNLTYFGTLIGYLDESTLLTYQGDTVQMVDIATATTTPLYTASGGITSVAWDMTAGTLAVGSATRGPVTWVLLDMESRQVIAELPELDAYQLASVSLTGPVSRTDAAAAFIRSSSDIHGDISVRGLDMRTGALSEPVITRTDARGDGFPRSPASTDGRFVETTNAEGDLVLIDSASGAAIELPVPDGAMPPDGGHLSITVIPGDECALLNIYDEPGSIGNSWVAPIEPGATWMELDGRIGRWIDIESIVSERPPPPAMPGT